jgi:HD superfamily phosphohydrolase
VTDKVFRDPVHGDISLPRPLVELCDTPEVQRMRSIRQLGTASLVYPGAVHTRFEHSLGTCHLTGRMLVNLGVDPHDHLDILAAALLHDITHIPYGHTLEDERRVFQRHDTPERLRHFLPRGGLGQKLKAHKLLEPVLAILGGKPERPWHSEVFSGAVCADLLDYLRRDAYFCGLPQSYDMRILNMFRVNEEDGRLYLEALKNGLVRQDVLSEVVNLLRLRYFLSERVYFHHTKTASGAMISRSVEAALEHGWQLKDLEGCGDEVLLHRLQAELSHDPIIGLLIGQLRSHQIHKRAYVITRRVGEERRRELVEHYHKNAQRRGEAEAEISRRCKLKPGELILYCPAYGMQLKEADMRVHLRGREIGPLSAVALPELQVLRERHQDLWKFYAFLAPQCFGKLAKVSHACEEFFREPNHLPALQDGQLYLDL